MKQAIRGFARAVTGWMRISRGGMVRPLPQGRMTAPLAKKAWRRNSAGMALALGACMAGAPLQAQQVSGSGSASSASAFAALTTDASEVRNEQVDARLLAYAPEGVAAGKPLWVGLQLTHQPHWHTYWRNPGDSGQATSLRWTLPAGMTAGDVRWPVPTRLPIGQLANYGYDGTVLLPVAVQVGPAWKAGASPRHSPAASTVVGMPQGMHSAAGTVQSHAADRTGANRLAPGLRGGPGPGTS